MPEPFTRTLAAFAAIILAATSISTIVAVPGQPVPMANAAAITAELA